MCKNWCKFSASIGDLESFNRFYFQAFKLSVSSSYRKQPKAVSIDLESCKGKVRTRDKIKLLFGKNNQDSISSTKLPAISKLLLRMRIFLKNKGLP